MHLRCRGFALSGIFFVALNSVAASAPQGCSVALAAPPGSLDSGHDALDLTAWWTSAERSDRRRGIARPERRMKQVNLNFRAPGRGRVMETADPTRPLSVTVADGEPRLYVFGSGRYAFRIRGGRLDNFLRGGIRHRSREPISIFYNDGTRMRGPYHTGNLPWDLFVTKWPVDMLDADDPARIRAEENGQSFVVVGYGGAMEQPYKLLGARRGDRRSPVQADNPTRSRHAFEIDFREGSQVWLGRGPVFGNLPSVERFWVEEHHEHGYGGRPVLNNDGSLWLDRYGKAWMLYEKVKEEKVVFEDGSAVFRTRLKQKLRIVDEHGRELDSMPRQTIRRRIPSVTEMVARRMRTPFAAYAPGELLPDGEPGDEEVDIFPVRPPSEAGPQRAAPYPVADRGGDDWHLFEGFNSFFLTIEGKQFSMIGGSGGNFVAGNQEPGKSYGVILGYREGQSGPIGLHSPIGQFSGDALTVENFSEKLGRKYGIIWGPGRPDFFPDERGDWWIICHGVREDTLPSHVRRGGWPESPEEWNAMYRALFLVPVEWSLRDGRPFLTILDPA